MSTEPNEPLDLEERKIRKVILKNLPMPRLWKPDEPPDIEEVEIIDTKIWVLRGDKL